MQPTLQDNQLLSKHRVLSFKPQLRLERRGQDGQSEIEQPDHSASLGDSMVGGFGDAEQMVEPTSCRPLVLGEHVNVTGFEIGHDQAVGAAA